jgi:hypothetical protein
VTRDGHRQRRALTAAEQALAALETGDRDAARRAAAEAASLDQVGAFSHLVGAVELAAADLAATGRVGDSAVSALLEAVGPGPLAARVEGLRGSG